MAKTFDEEYPHFVTADAHGATQVEVHSIEKQKDRLMVVAGDNMVPQVRHLIEEVPQWLPLASEVLGISRNIKDYVLVPVVSMPTDLPNKNQQAFAFSDLTAWNAKYGQPAYKTWNGKPCHIDHINDDPTQAKGIILSTILKPIKGAAGDIFKVIKMTAWDRTRDVDLVNKILTRKRTAYSMGAYASDFTCSVCGASHNKGGCEHVQLGKTNFKVFNNVLAYLNSKNPVGFEISSVEKPAFVSADNPQYINWI